MGSLCSSAFGNQIGHDLAQPGSVPLPARIAGRLDPQRLSRGGLEPSIAASQVLYPMVVLETSGNR
jgi:hypothetical protein